MRTLHFAFRGHFERDSFYVYAVCDDAPLATSGEGKDAALARMGESIRLYLRLLAERKEVESAVAAGLVKVALRRPSADLNAASVKKSADGFVIHLGAVA